MLQVQGGYHSYHHQGLWNVQLWFTLVRLELLLLLLWTLLQD